MPPKATKRPHYVPECYLKPWADGDRQIAVRRRGSADVFTPNTTNVAVDAGIYGRGEAGQMRERIFGLLEESWPDLRATLLGRGGYVHGDARSTIALFAAVQLVRTRERFAQVEFVNSFAEYSDVRPADRDAMRDFLAQCHLHFEPSDREVEAAWTIAYVALNQGDLPSKDDAVGMMLNIATRELGPRLERSSWVVEHCRRPMLFTSDRPVMCWRPRSARDRYEGIGIESADEIRMPLTPNDLLVIRHTGSDGGIQDVQPKRFERVNGGIASQCHEFLVGTRSCKEALRYLPLAAHRPVLRFDIGPGVQEEADGSHEPMGDIIHTWVPGHAERGK
jgi:hypothetical protein